MTFSRAQLAGQVQSNPEKRFTPNNTAVVTFTLAVPPLASKTEEAPYLIQVTCWARSAEAVAEQVQQGDTVLVDGRLQVDSIQNPDGSNKKMFAVDSATVYKVSGAIDLVQADTAGMPRKMTTPPTGPAPSMQQAGVPQQAPLNPVAAGALPAQAPASAPSMAPAELDDDIPF